MGEEATIAAPTAQAPQQRRPLREQVLAGQFFGQQHGDAAGELAAFLHGKLGFGEALEAWFGEAVTGLLAAGGDRLRAALDRDIADIDAALGDQLDAVLHHPRFRALEGRWRGLAWLISGIEPGRRVKVRLLPVSWSELCRDLERALEFDQSITFRRIYEEEFGMPGGEPYGLMVIDHAVRHRVAAGATTDDVGGLAQLSAVAAAAFMPTVLSLDPSVLEVDTFSDLEGVRDITAPLRGAQSPALAKPLRARRHALRGRHPAAPAGASSLGGRARSSGQVPLQRTRADGGHAGMDECRIRLRRLCRARLPGQQLAGRCARGGDRPCRRRACRQSRRRAVRQRSAP